jgi:hypothetical protein
MRLSLTSTSSIPNSGVTLEAFPSRSAVIVSRPEEISWAASWLMNSSSSSVISNSRLLERTTSMRAKLATALRVSPSMMSSRRLCPPRSSRTRW